MLAINRDTGDKAAVAIVVAVIGLFICGLVIVRQAWPPSDPARDQVIMDGFKGVGFTSKQAKFLRFGPVGGETCRTSGFEEVACSFLRRGGEDGRRRSDAVYYADCQDASLTKDQCTILRVGVDRFREARS